MSDEELMMPDHGRILLEWSGECDECGEAVVHHSHMELDGSGAPISREEARETLRVVFVAARRRMGDDDFRSFIETLRDDARSSELVAFVSREGWLPMPGPFAETGDIGCLNSLRLLRGDVEIGAAEA